jgi:hypothetical protein
MSLSLHDSPFDDAVLRLTPAHYYPFNGSGGTERQSDKVSGGVDLTNNGTIPFSYAAIDPFASGYPKFTGDATQYFEAVAASAGYGQPSYAYMAWVNLDSSTFAKVVGDYTVLAEHGASGTSGIDFEMHWPSNGGLTPQVTQTDDFSQLTQHAGSGVGSGNSLLMLLAVRSATQLCVYMNGGRNFVTTTGGVRTMTNAGTVSLRIGGGGRSGAMPWQGAIFRVAFWNTAAAFLNPDGTFNDARVRALYEIGLPVATSPARDRHLKEPMGFPRKSIWRQRMPQGAFPIDTSVNQSQVGAALATSFQQTVQPQMATTGSSGIKLYCVEEGVDAYTLQRVRMGGGRYGNAKVDREGIWQAMSQVPIPAGLVSSGMMTVDDDHRGLGGSQQLDGNDRNTVIRFKRTDGRISLWELWHCGQYLGYSSVDNSGYTLTPQAAGSGSIPAGSYRAAIAFYNANGLGWAFASPSPGATLDGTQALNVALKGLMEDPADANPGVIGVGEGYQGIAVYVINDNDVAPTWRVAKRIAFGGGFPKPTLGTKPTTPTAPSGVASQSGGALAAGSYAIQVSAVGQWGQTLASPKSAVKTITTATGSIAWTWPAVSGAVSYNVFGRSNSTVGKLITNVSTPAWTDDGTLPVGTTALPNKDNSGNVAINYTLTDLSAAESGLGSDGGVLAPFSGQTTDVSCGTGGFYDDIRQSKGWYDQLGPGGVSRTDWGFSASNVMNAGGLILAHEAAAGVIPHRIGVSITKGSKITFRYPAHGTDSSISPLVQGMVLAWPRGTMAAFFATRPTTVAGKPWPKLFVAIFRCGEEYGFLLKDSTAQGFQFLSEEDTVRGRSLWRSAFGDYAPAFGSTPSQDADGGLHLLPWTSLQVVSTGYVQGEVGGT